MAPHSNDAVVAAAAAPPPKQSSHRRAKSSRVAPAIPYALVKPKVKKAIETASKSPKEHKPIDSPVASSSGKSQIDTTQPKSESPSRNAPATPVSVSSGHDKNANGSATPAGSLSDRIQDSDSKQPSSSTTSPPSAHAVPSPKSASSSFKSGLPPLTMPGKPGRLNNDPSSATSTDVEHGQSNGSNGQFRGHQHKSSKPVNGHGHAHSNSESIPPPYMFHAPPSNVTMMPPPGMISQSYNGFTSPPSVASPTSGWNPNANFIPPNYPSQRPVYDSMSERAVSQTSSTPDARSAMPPMGNSSENFQWTRYISNFYSDSSFADFSLSISRGYAHTFPEFPAHGIVLARSPTFHNLMRNLANPPKRNEVGTKLISLQINEKLTSYSAVLEAIGYLYGLPLANFSDGVTPNAPFSVVMDRMTSALALAGAGQRLGLPEVMAHGLTFASGFLSWATFDKALAFAHASLTTLPGKEQSDARSQDLATLCMHHASSLMYSLEGFLISNFPAGFEFSSTAPELQEACRLPKIVEVRASAHNPLLNTIQFGNMPSQDPEALNSGILLSRILLSVPSQFLSRMMDSHELATKLGASSLVSLMRAVVEEREARRLKVIKAGKRLVPEESPFRNAELNWTESVVEHPQAPLGFAVVRFPVEASDTAS